MYEMVRQMGFWGTIDKFKKKKILFKRIYFINIIRKTPSFFSYDYSVIAELHEIEVADWSADRCW